MLLTPAVTDKKCKNTYIGDVNSGKLFLCLHLVLHWVCCCISHPVTINWVLSKLHWLLYKSCDHASWWIWYHQKHHLQFWKHLGDKNNFCCLCLWHVCGVDELGPWPCSLRHRSPAEEFCSSKNASGIHSCQSHWALQHLVLQNTSCQNVSC